MAISDLVDFFEKEKPYINQSGNVGNVKLTPTLPKKPNENNAVTPVTLVTSKNNIPKLIFRIKSDSFIADTPFTPAMIQAGLANGQQPLSHDDIDDIEAGRLPVEQVQGYLFMWVREHREQFERLKVLASEAKEVFKPDLLHLLADLELLRDDRLFIEALLISIPIREREAVLQEYRQHWEDATAIESDVNKKANAGRRAANSWLRMRHIDHNQR